MGRKEWNRGSSASSVANPQQHVSMTLREVSSGKKLRNVNAKSMTKIDHLKELANWAATDVSIPALGAFFGQRLAASTESLGIRSDSSLFFCQRCESILKPGHNCTVRIEKNKPKKKHRCRKSNSTTRNSVVYKCLFCSHRNLMRGTPHGHIKEINPPQTKQSSELKLVKCSKEKSAGYPEDRQTISGDGKIDTSVLHILNGQNLEPSSPTSPFPTPSLSLLDSKRKRKNRSGVKKVDENEGSPVSASAGNSLCNSKKRRRKSWTSLKDIACSNEQETVVKLAKLTASLVQ